MNLILAAELFGNGGGGSLYQKHAPTEVDDIEMFSSFKGGTVYDIYEDEDNVVAVCNKSTGNVAIKDKSSGTVTVLNVAPISGSDATDLPQDLSEFYDNTNTLPRSVADVGDYYVVGIRLTSGSAVDGTHLYGGIAFVSKSTKTVAKCYWYPYIISRVVWDSDSQLLVVALQRKGISFYTLSGTAMTEKETFIYDWTDPADNGHESQHGCFFTAANGHRCYANVGFGVGVRFYDVEDTSDITYLSQFLLTSIETIGSDSHTYTGVCQYPYLYITVAKDDKTAPHAELDGIATIDISDVENPVALHYEHIRASDAQKWNGASDTKPTEMVNYRGMLYTNYEHGYLAFEIDATGKSTHYCGNYQKDILGYGIDVRADGNIFYGYKTDDNKGYLAEYAEDVHYTITNTLSHVTTSNSKARVLPDEAYSATLTVESGYELASVSVTMGGVDITSTAYDNGVITIAEVTGNVAIVASASAPVNAYWKPSDGTINQYSSSKPCTITASGEDLSLVISQGNSGIKTSKSIESPTALLKLKLIADTATITEPTSTRSLFFTVNFYNSEDTRLKQMNYFSGTTTEYVSDVTSGITKSFSVADVGTATRFEVVIRTNNSSDTSLFPANVAFTNLRIEVAE